MSRPTGSVRFDNAGRVVLVTGGLGGIGLAICEAFAGSKAAGVVAVDCRTPGEMPPGVVYFQANLADETECAAAVQFAIERFGGLDVLVNTAAIQPPESYVPVDELPAEVWERMLSINVSGYTYMAKHALRQMKAQRSGVVVNIASAQAFRTARGVPAYGPAKAANVMQARQWGVEYARHGIRVVSVSPGAIRTPLLLASLAAQGGGDALANRHPLGRLGEPHEVAAAVLWLASNNAAFVTATDLAVDGGLDAFGAFADPYSPA